MQNIGFESSNKIEKINSEIGISNERIQNNTANKQRLEAEILEVKSRIEELKEEQKQKLEKKTNLTSNKEKFEKELAEKEAELAELSKKLSAKELEIEGKKQIVQNNINGILLPISNFVLSKKIINSFNSTQFITLQKVCIINWKNTALKLLQILKYE